MPQPTKSDVHVNRPLTNISIAYIQGAGDFIADRVFPNIPVTKQSDRYFKYDKDFWFRTETAVRAPGTESAGSGFTVDSTPTYYAPVYAVHKDVDDQTRANTDDPLDTDRDATLFVTQQMMLKRDQVWAQQYFGTGKGWTDVTGVTGTPTGNQVKQWSAAGSDPMTDITTWTMFIQSQTAFKPNTLVIGPQVYAILSNHSIVLDRIKYTQRGVITTDLLAALFGVDRVLIANAVVNSAEEGQTGAYGFVFGKAALLCYANPSPGLMQPSAGYTFSWNGLLGASALGHRIKRFRIDAIESDRIEAEMAFDFKLVSADLGVFFDQLVA